jgi:hypothetical protein
MIEGSGSGFVPLNNGSGSGSPKKIRIRICNTAKHIGSSLLMRLDLWIVFYVIHFLCEQVSDLLRRPLPQLPPSLTSRSIPIPPAQPRHHHRSTAARPR